MAVCEIWDVRGRLDHPIDYAENPEKTANPKYTEADLQAMVDVMEYATNKDMASTLVWNGAPALFRGVRTNAAISRTGLSRSLQAAYKALSGLRKEDNGRTVALRQKQDTLSSSIGKVTVLQTMWVL